MNIEKGVHLIPLDIRGANDEVVPTMGPLHSFSLVALL
jgi:hypothetical protein